MSDGLRHVTSHPPFGAAPRQVRPPSPLRARPGGPRAPRHQPVAGLGPQGSVHVGLRDVPDVSGLEPDHPRADGLAPTRPSPRARRCHESGFSGVADAKRAPTNRRSACPTSRPSSARRPSVSALRSGASSRSTIIGSTGTSAERACVGQGDVDRVVLKRAQSAVEHRLGEGTQQIGGAVYTGFLTSGHHRVELVGLFAAAFAARRRCFDDPVAGCFEHISQHRGAP